MIADISGVPIQAYDIQPAPSYLSYQTQNIVPDWGAGAVGLAIDTDSEMLFITYEGSNVIQLINATTMTDEGTATAPTANNLAGIVVDQDKQKVYTVDRSTNQLYVYTWNEVTKTLTLDGGTYKILPSVTSAHGLALDEINDLLYVGDMVATNNVRVFSTADWSEQAVYTVSQPVQGIAVDVTNGIIYTGHAGWPAYGSLNLLCKYDMTTDIETTVDIRTLTSSEDEDAVVGLAVDPTTSLLYITTGNQGSEGRVYDDTDMIMVFDSGLNVLKTTDDIGDPTGLCIPGKDTSFNPLNLAKTDGVTTVLQGGQLTYSISFDNLNNANPVTGVTLVDMLPPEASFDSATGPGASYNSGTHTVSWTIPDLAASAPSQTVTVTVTVKSGTLVGTFLDNAVTINGNEAGTGPTTKHDLDTEVVSTPTNAFVISSDNTGTEKNVFDLNEDVYCYAGNLPDNDLVNIYVVPNKAWSVGDSIGSDVSGGVETVSTDASGEIGVTQIWTALLTAGKYDIIVDVNQDGILDANEPVDGLTMGEGFEAIPEFPTIVLPMAAILGLAFIFQRRKD